MTDEEKILTEEKLREKYFYVDKERTYQVLTGITTSFIGAGLALILFAVLYKPSVPPCPIMKFHESRPCPIKMLPQNRPHRIIPGGRHFRGHGGPEKFGRFHRERYMPEGNFEFRRPDDKINRPVPPIARPIPPQKK